jgi:hypothetical protein
MSKISTRPLDPQEQEGIAYATAWINDVLEQGFKSDVRLTGTRDDIPTLHTLLSQGPYGEDVASELMLFGTAFGEILAKEIPMHWIVLEDEQGADLALQFGDLEVFVFPRDMILKRAERGEDIASINLEVLLEELRVAVEEQARNA